MSDLLEILGDAKLRVLDIGARHGLFNLFLSVAQATEVVGFEPDAEEVEHIREGLRNSSWAHVDVFPYALGQTVHDRDFHIFKRDVLSSLLLPNRAVMPYPEWEVARTVKLDTVSFDDLYSKGVLSGRYDFIKVDTQGSELEILKSGAQTLLPNLLAIELEAEFIEQYVGQPRFSEIELYLREQQFELVALTPRYEYSPMNGIIMTRRRMSFCDAVFMRHKSWLDTLSSSERTELLPRLVTIYSLYGLCGEAFQIAANYDQALASKIKAYAVSKTGRDRHWYIGLVRDTLLCLLNPTRATRIRLARKALQVRDEERWLWSLQDLTLNL